MKHVVKTAFSSLVLTVSLFAATDSVPAAPKVALSKATPVSDSVSIQTESIRKPRTGGAGGLTLGFQSRDMTPIIEMIQRRELEEATLTVEDSNEVRIAGLKFGQIMDTREIFPTITAIGYTTFDNGMRIGGTVRASVNGFAAKRNDSTFTLYTGTGWGGLLVEKVFFPSPKTSVLFGGNIGAGGTGVVIRGKQGSSSGLATPKSDTIDYVDEEYDNLVGGAGFFLGELHVASTVSLKKWLHLGAEISTEINHSRGGFNMTDGFTTVSPGGSLRIIFGRS